MDSRSASGELTSCPFNIQRGFDWRQASRSRVYVLMSLLCTQPFVEIDIFAHINTNTVCIHVPPHFHSPKLEAYTALLAVTQWRPFDPWDLWTCSSSIRAIWTT